MGKSRRDSAPKAGSLQAAHGSSKNAVFSPSDSQPLIPFLSHLTNGCSVQDLDTRCCIPLFLPRCLSENAVRKLKAIIDVMRVIYTAYDSRNSVKSVLAGYFSGSPTSIVVPLIGNLAYLLEDYLKEQGCVDEDMEINICLLYTSPSPRDQRGSRMPSSA